MKKCLSYALKLLTKKDYSTMKLVEKLKVREFTEEDIEQTVLYLKDKNYLNDQRYLTSFISYHLKQKKGPEYIKNKSAEKGLHPTDEMIEDLYYELKIDREKIIQEHVNKKIKFDNINIEELDYNNRIKVLAKINRYLMNKGFQVNNIDKYFQELL